MTNDSGTRLAPEHVAELSTLLLGARAARSAIPPLTEARPDLTVEDAYAIARDGVDRDLAGGARLVGHKIGLTAVAVQQQLGVDTPDFGALLDTMQLEAGSPIAASQYLAPRIELELAFRLSAPLAGPGVTVADVRAATECVLPSIELVDSRIADWRITLPDTVADRASSAGFILGAETLGLDEFDVTGVGVELHRGDELIESGRSDAVLGDPCAAVAWLANALGALGDSLAPGEVILSGACTKMVPIAAGESYRASFEGFGELDLEVVA